MPLKELMIKDLENMISMIQHSDGDQAVLRKIYNQGLFSHFWYKEFECRLDRLDKNINNLLMRPVSSCCMAGEEVNDVRSLMIGRGSAAREDAIAKLNDKFYGAKKLVICDSYFLKRNKKHLVKEYLNWIDTVIPATVNSIDLYVKPKMRDTDIALQFNYLCKKRGIKLTCCKTEEIHDRVWIIDSKRAFVIGTSFNGLGEKFAFTLELPDEDRDKFIQEITSLKKRAIRSNSA